MAAADFRVGNIWKTCHIPCADLQSAGDVLAAQCVREALRIRVENLVIVHLNQRRGEVGEISQQGERSGM